MLLHRGEGRDRLPDRAGRIQAERCLVDARVVLRLGGSFVQERSDLLGVDAAGEERGLKVGFDASARMAPVLGSRATIAPPLAAHWPLACASAIPLRSARSAARWSLMSIVNWIATPGPRLSAGWSALRGRPSESTRICASPGLPRRISSFADSTPT